MTIDPAALQQLEVQIGGPPWQGKYPPLGWSIFSTASSINLRSWCIAKGMDLAKVNSLDRVTLEKCYCIGKNYFDVVAGNRPARLPQNQKDFSSMARQSYRPNAESLLDGITPEKLIADQLRENFKSAAQYESSTPTPHQDFEKNRQVFEQYIQSTISKEVKALNRDMATNIPVIVSQTVSGIIPSIHEGVKNALLQGVISIPLSKSLEDQILSKTQTVTEDLVIQTLIKNRGKRQEEKETQEEEEFDLDLFNPDSSLIPDLDPDFYFDPFPARVIRKAIQFGSNVYASGDTGCGKTALFLQTCAVLNRPIIRINPHDGITKESFIGGIGLKSGETYYSYGALPRAMRDGIPLLVDEIDYLPPNLAAVLNPVAERGGKLYIPETDETILPARGFCIFATANTGGKGDNNGQYTGTEIQNTALLDRFPYKIKMNYLPFDEEVKMLQKRFPNESWQMIAQLARLATEIRSAFSRGELSYTFSTRKLIDFFSQLSQGFSLTEALGLCILSWLDEDDFNLVKSIIDRLQIKLED